MMWLLAQDIRIIEDFGTKYSNQTTIHPVGLAMTIGCGLALLALPRRFAIWPFILMACLVASAQRIVVAGLDFDLIRILVVFGVIRVATRAEHALVRFQVVDGLVVVFAVARTVIYTVREGEWVALVFQAGQTFDAVGLYFLFRCLIRSIDDIVHTIAGFAIMSVPVMIAFAIEHLTGRNGFAIFGGVPEFTVVREDRLRCTGAFAHPIIAGCFWASMLPPMVALLWRGHVNKMLGIFGVICGTGIIVFTASSTPVMGLLFGLLGGLMFYVRWWMKWVVLAGLVLGIFLHLSMNAPIWHLICRITIAKGNTGYHRYLLIDNAIHRFDEWALLGTSSTAHWFWGGQDVTNQFVLEGLRGGVISLVLFSSIIVMCFIYVGRSWRATCTNRGTVVLAWSLGVALWVHVTSFIAVSYFGQGIFVWYLHIAMIVSLREACQHRLPTLAMAGISVEHPVLHAPARGANASSAVYP